MLASLAAAPVALFSAQALLPQQAAKQLLNGGCSRGGGELPGLAGLAAAPVGCRLLRETDTSIAQIALDCGFADHSAFTRAFRAVTSYSPSEYCKLTT